MAAPISNKSPKLLSAVASYVLIWKRHLSQLPPPKYFKIIESLFFSSNKYYSCHAKFLFAFPVGFSTSTKVLASSAHSHHQDADVKNFEPNDARLRSSECLKNAAGLAVDSTSAVLSQTVYAIIKIEQQYIELIDVLIKLLEYQVQVLKHKSEVERIEDIVLETRDEIKKIYQRKQDLALLFNSVEKLADATAEVAYATGADYASTSAGERLHSAQQEVQHVQALSEKAEKELLIVETGVIAKVTQHEEEMKKKKAEVQEGADENNSNESKSFREGDGNDDEDNKKQL